MKRTLFLTLIGLATMNTRAETYVSVTPEHQKTVYASDVTSFLNGGDSNMGENNREYTLEGDIELTKAIALRNTGSVLIHNNSNSLNTASLKGTGGTHFLNTGVSWTTDTPVVYRITGLTGLSFSGYTGYANDGSAYGVMAAYAPSRHEFEVNGNTGDVIFENNTLTSTSELPVGKLYGSVFTTIDSYSNMGTNSHIQLSGNGANSTLSISGNKTTQSVDAGSEMKYAYAGAIYASGNCDVEITQNNSNVTLNNNEVSSAGSHATGGAIAMHGTGQVVQFESNISVELKGNKAISTWSNPDQSGDYVTAGGAIYAPTAEVSLCGSNGNYTDSNTVDISNNVAEMTNGNVRGGAIDAGNLDISQNKNVVEISGNHASSTSTTGTYSALGGALSTTLNGGIHKISQNGNESSSYKGGVNISNNYASTSSTQGTARGGFFYGAEGTTLEISDNHCDVTISGNYVSSASTADDAALGGAIYGSSLVIKDNQAAVQLRGNYEKNGYSCRLRAVYLDSTADDARLELSAGSGYNITFHDSVYANVNNIIINGSSNGGGSVIFSGGDVESYLSEYAGVDTPSAEDVEASRTSYFGSVINVHGGTLEARNAILQGEGLTTKAASGATVLLNNAAMQHSGDTVQFNSGTTLAAQGVSTLAAGKLQMENLSSMEFILTKDNETDAALTYTGELSLAGDLQLNVQVPLTVFKGTVKLLTLDDAAKENWDNGYRKLVSFQTDPYSPVMGNLEWQGNTLVYTCWAHDDDKLITWGNNSQDGRWDNLSQNWNYDGKAVSHTGVNDVYFNDSGSGTVTLYGTLTPSKVYLRRQ